MHVFLLLAGVSLVLLAVGSATPWLVAAAGVTALAVAHMEWRRSRVSPPTREPALVICLCIREVGDAREVAVPDPDGPTHRRP